MKYNQNQYTVINIYITFQDVDILISCHCRCKHAGNMANVIHESLIRNLTEDINNSESFSITAIGENK